MSYNQAFRQEVGFAPGICDVHRLLEGDVRQRLVAWCNFCKAYLCEPCSKNPWRRAKAATLKALGR